MAANGNFSKFLRQFNIDGVYYAEVARKEAYFSEVVLIMDCCRDPLANTLSQRGLAPATTPEAASGTYFYAFATLFGAKARERSHPNGRVQGVFTMTLLEAFDRAEPNGSEDITPSVLDEYVTSKMNDLLPGQKPRFPRNCDFPLLQARPAHNYVGFMTVLGPAWVPDAGAVGDVTKVVDTSGKSLMHYTGTTANKRDLPAGDYTLRIKGLPDLPFTIPTDKKMVQVIARWNANPPIAEVI